MKTTKSFKQRSFNLPKRRFIRPGQRHPYRKGTRQQIDERIGYVSRLLRTGKTKTEIHRAVRQRFNVQWRQCDRYIAFVTGTNTSSTTRLPRVRVEHRSILLSEMLAKARLLYDNKAK